MKRKCIAITFVIMLFLFVFMQIWKLFNGANDSVQDTIDGHEYVDMGLSVKWATMNLGASSIYEEGQLYAWGETKGYGEPIVDYAKGWKGKKNENYVSQKIKKSFTWNAYKWVYKYDNRMKCKLSKYCDYDRYGELDSIITLLPEDDAANVNWGGGWRMPTKEEFEELIEHSEFDWVENYNGSSQSGWLVYSDVTGKTLFFPVNKKVTCDSLSWGDNASWIWLSTVSGYDAYSGCFCNVSDEQLPLRLFTATERCRGLAIRPVHQ